MLVVRTGCNKMSINKQQTLRRKSCKTKYFQANIGNSHNRECYKAKFFKFCNEYNDRDANRETAEVRQTYRQLTSQTYTWQLLEQRNNGL
jgi:hypothetical protein